MTRVDLFKWCCDFLDDYSKAKADELASAIMNGIKDSDDPNTVAMKMAVNSSLYTSQISAMTVISLLIDIGVIEPSELDVLEPPQPLKPLS